MIDYSNFKKITKSMISLLQKHSLVLAFTLTLFATQLNSQHLYVREKAGNQTEYVIDNISKLSFSNGNLIINQTNGNNDNYIMSDIRYLNFNDLTSIINPFKNQYNNELHIFPNPAKNLVNIKLNKTEPGTYNIKIQSVSGQTLTGITREIEKGDRLISLDVNGISPGFYILSLHYAYNSISTKLIIK